MHRFLGERGTNGCEVFFLGWAAPKFLARVLVNHHEVLVENGVGVVLPVRREKRHDGWASVVEVGRGLSSFENNLFALLIRKIVKLH